LSVRVKRGRARLNREAAMGEFSPWHLLILAAVLVLLFGANKLPQMARSVGQSMRIFNARPHDQDPMRCPVAHAG
jgi:TatA/E family protein of Tat protein translocase